MPLLLVRSKIDFLMRFLERKEISSLIGYTSDLPYSFVMMRFVAVGR